MRLNVQVLGVDFASQLMQFLSPRIHNADEDSDMYTLAGVSYLYLAGDYPQILLGFGATRRGFKSAFRYRFEGYC